MSDKPKAPPGKHPNSLKNLRPSKPGMTNNPAGKPKGLRSFKTLIGELLELVPYAQEMGDSEELDKFQKAFEKQFGKTATRWEILILRQINLAMMGDTRAFNAIADRFEGKPKQTIEATVDSYEDFLKRIEDDE